jgi:hypothetical protein
MPYGNQQGLIGEGMDPRLLQQDFSGYTNAASIQATAVMGAANTVATQIKDYTQEQKRAKEQLKSGAMMIDAASKMFPSQGPALSGIAQQLKDENIPLNERAAMAAQVGDLINMSVGEGRYQQGLAMEQTKLDNATQESSMRQWAYGQEVTKGEREASAYALDAKTKATIGPALLESVLNMAPASISGEVRKSMVDATPEQQYSIANSVMSLIPKRDDKAPAIQSFGVPGGTMSLQWDGAQWGPIQTALSTAVFDPSRLPAGLQPHAQEFAAAGAKYGVDPRILAAIAMHETGNGTSSAFKTKNNAMGISNASGPVDTGTVAASIDQMARLLAAGTQGKGPYAGKKTIADIAKVYAPEGAGNDPKNLNKFWTDGVEGNVAKLGGDPDAEITYTPPTPIGFTPTGADGAGALTEKQKYDIEQDKVNTARTVSSAAAEAQGFIGALDELEKHPGFTNLFGINLGVPTWASGSAGADAKAVLGKVQGKAFLEAIQKMRGMGALSEKEGQTATKAYSALDPSMSEAAAKKEIATLKGILAAGAAKAAAMGAAPPPDPVMDAANRLRGYIKPR